MQTIKMTARGGMVHTIFVVSNPPQECNPVTKFTHQNRLRAALRNLQKCGVLQYFKVGFKDGQYWLMADSQAHSWMGYGILLAEGRRNKQRQM